MSIGDLLFELPRHVKKKTVRKIENTQRKLAKAKNALVFNQTSIKENLLPNYNNIYIYIYIYIYICVCVLIGRSV